MPDASTPVLLPLEIGSLYFRVQQETLIDNIDLTVSDPGITVVMGSNGAGKSLLLRLIHGLLNPSSGHILWNGRGLDIATRRRQALVFQKPVLMRRSVAANIDFVLKADGHRRQRRDQLLQEAGLLRQASQAARLLSGGEQQRLALARALATEPEVLLLDEPCANIDGGATLQIEHMLQQVRERGVKIILVTHDTGQARRLADDIVFMHHGRVLEHRPAQDFFDSPASAAGQAYLNGQIIL